MTKINSLKPVLAPAVDHGAKAHLVQPRLFIYDFGIMWFWHVLVNSEIAVF